MAQPLSTPPEIELIKGTERERETRDLLLGLFEQYPLDKWRYTERVRIEEGVIPHSHPVLTLSPGAGGTDYLADPEQLLGAYIHEQMHWFTLLVKKSENSGRAIKEFREMYPELPVELPEGCGSEFSNYLHIQVNYLEYLGLSELLGIGRAREVISRITHYTRIYDLVLKDTERIGEVMSRYGLIPGEQPPEDRVFVKVS